MGTYLYTGKLIKRGDEHDGRDYIIFSNDAHMFHDGLKYDKRIKNVAKAFFPKRYLDYLYEYLLVINLDKSVSIREKCKDFLDDRDILNVHRREICFPAEIQWSYKISSDSNDNEIADKLSNILTDSDVDLLYKSCDYIEDNEEYFEWLRSEIKKGEIIYNLSKTL